MEHSVYPRCTQHATMEANTMQETALLELRGICKFFPGVRALDGVDFTLCKGEIHALMGENGAGKSTLIKVLTGVYSKDEGTISMEGTPVQIRTTQDALKAGISTVYQEITLCPNLTVAENLYIGRTKGAFTNWRKMNAGAKKLLSSLGIPAAPTQQLSSCSIAVQQMVAIARAVDMECKVLILDEPTVGLDPKQIIEIRDLIKSLGKKHTVILSSHILSEVSAVCDYVMIIAKGQLVASDTPENLSKLMLGSNTVTCTVHGTRKQLVPALNALDAKEIQYENTPNEEQIKVKITTEKDKDIREELFYALAKANCPILELTSSSMSLEDVFLELTDDSGKAARKLKKAEKEQLKQKECEKECEPEADKTAVGETSEEKSTDAAESAAETKQEEGDAQ